MKYYLVTEFQTCYVEYLVGADSVPQARSKAKVIDQDVVELPGCPTYIKTTSYEVSQIKDTTDPVIEKAVKTIESNYVTEEPPKKKKRKRRNFEKELDEVEAMIDGQQ